MEETYKRIEIVGYKCPYNEGGAGEHMGWVMNKYGLTATPWEVREKHQHWFTPKGFEQVGKKLLEHAEKQVFQLGFERTLLQPLKERQSLLKMTYKSQ